MTIILTVIIIILTVLLIISSVVIRNLLIQNDTFEETIQIYSNKIESVELETIKYHKYFLELFTQTYQELHRIDKRGAFSSDDEVGFSFRVIISAIETLKDKLKSIEVEEVDSEKR